MNLRCKTLTRFAVFWFISCFFCSKNSPRFRFQRNKRIIFYKGFCCFRWNSSYPLSPSSCGTRRGYDFKRCRLPCAVCRAVVAVLSLRSCVGLLCVLSFLLCLFPLSVLWAVLLLWAFGCSPTARNRHRFYVRLAVSAIGGGGRQTRRLPSYQYYTAENLSRAS